MTNTAPLTKGETMSNANKTKTIDCPKCDGLGVIGAFGHIASGVCFCCNGNKTITINPAELIAKVSTDSRTKAEWVLNSTPQSYAGLSFSKQTAIRDFCHGGWGLPEAYPNLLAHWFDVANESFCIAQDNKLAEHYAS